MNDTNITELESLARAAAEQLAGSGAIEQVEVRSGADVEDRPAYHFWFLIDRQHTINPPGLITIRLRQRLRDALDARGDSHIPTIRLLNREDWGKRTDGRPF